MWEEEESISLTSVSRKEGYNFFDSSDEEEMAEALSSKRPGTTAKSSQKSLSGWDRVVAAESESTTSHILPPSQKQQHQHSITEASLLQSDVETLIAERIALQAELTARTSTDASAVVRAALQGRSVSLESFRSLRDKLSLLDEAVAAHAGGLITRVTLFVRSTLRPPKFHSVMLTRPVACQHLCHYYLRTRRWSELDAFCTGVGGANMTEARGAAAVRHVFSRRDIKARATAVAACLGMHQSATDTLRPSVVTHLRAASTLYGLQTLMAATDSTSQHPAAAARVPLSSALSTLYYSCRFHYGAPSDSKAGPEQLKKSLMLSDRQYEYVAVNALTLNKQWDQIERLVRSQKTLLFAARIAPKAGIPALVRNMLQAKAPPEAVRKYVELVTDPETRLDLAERAGCHDTVIETIIKLRDHLRLQKYALHPEVKADAALSARVFHTLRNEAIKWK